MIHAHNVPPQQTFLIAFELNSTIHLRRSWRFLGYRRAQHYSSRAPNRPSTSAVNF